jgi:YqjK-like protein
MFGRGARHRELAVRRETLRLRSGLLRDRLAGEVQALQAPLAWADRAVDAALWLRRHPEWPVGLAAVLLVVRPRILLRWGTRGWAAWRLWRRARPYVLIARKAWDRSVGT